MTIRRFSSVTILAAVALLGVTTAASARALHLQVALGQQVRVFGHVRFGRDCEPGPVPQMTIVRGPSKGTLDVREETVTLTSPDFGSAKCTGHTGNGKVVYYTRTKPGTDHFDYRMSSPGLPTTDWNITAAGG